MPFGSGPFGTVVFGSGPRRSGGAQTLSQFTLRIGSEDVRPYLRWNRWDVNENLNGRDTSTMHLLVKPSSPHPNYLPAEGAPVLVQFGNVRYWRGKIYDRECAWTTEARNDLREITLRCVDRTEVADRITVREIYEHQTAGAIVRHIVTKYLAEDGITADGVREGPLIQKVVFAGDKYAADCFDALCKLVGYHWTIDQYDVMQFFPKFASLAPFEISHDNAVFRQMRITRSLADFRNTQYTIGGMGITPPVTEYAKGDDTTRTFPTAYPIASLISVKVNGALGTQGIRNVDDAGSKDWYWNKNQQGINQDPSRPILRGATATQPADQVEITYQGYYGPVANKLVDSASITARKAIEGGSGRYEVVDHDANLDGLEVTIAKARGDMRRFGPIDDKAQFETDRIGLAVGQTVKIKLPELGVPDVDMLITSMRTSLFGMEKRRHSVTATSGELKGTYKEFYDTFLSRGVPVTLSPDDAINEIIVATDAAQAADLVTVSTSAAHLGVWGVDTWGKAQWG